MNKNQVFGNTIKFIALIFLGIAIIFGIVYGLLGSLNRSLNRQQLINTPPSVFVQYPSSGETAREGDLLPAGATATGKNPISRLELWLDGEKIQEKSPDSTNQNTFAATFTIEITAGSHTLVFRVVDTMGSIGQSLPIQIVGELSIENEAITITTEEEQTLDEIARAADAEADILHQLNPDLGAQPLPAGTNILIPPPPSEGKQGDQPQDGAEPPSNLPQQPLPDPTGAYQVEEVFLPSLSIGDIFSVIRSHQPAAPTALQVGYEDCVVRMQWKDNAKTETHFNIWMQREYGPPQLIATTSSNPENSPTIYEFKSPPYGFYNFWVEAANAIGSQPSAVRSVFVSGRDCGLSLATHIEIVAEDMFVFGGYDRTYCYLSIEGQPEKRVPEKADQFIDLQNNFGNITNYWGIQKSIVYPMPEDEEITLEGKCMGLMGGFPISLGNFQTSIAREKWDGSRLELQPSGDGYLIGYHIQPVGSTQAEGRYSYIDYDLPAPEVWQVEAGTSEIPTERDWKARQVTLTWSWAGDQEKLNSFLILINGEEFRYVAKVAEQESFFLGTSCGEDYTFQVIAVGFEGARSVPSNSLPYHQPECEKYAEVEFDSFTLTAMDDSEFGDCDEAELRFRLSTGFVTRETYEVSCFTEYQFSQFRGDGGKPPEPRFIPIDSSDPNPEVSVGAKFDDLNYIGPYKWDRDDLCSYEEKISLNELAEIGEKHYTGACPNITYIYTHNGEEVYQEGEITLTYTVRYFSTPKE